MQINNPLRRAKRLGARPLLLEALDVRLAPATFSVADTSIVEGDEGVANMVFTVTRAGDLAATATVGYSTVAGTATPNVDYLPMSGSLTFGPNILTQTINVPILGDYLFENNENFTVQLTPGVTDRRANNVQLAPKQDTVSALTPVGVNIADMNSDGVPDVITADESSDLVSILRNATVPGSPTITLTNKLDLPTGTRPLDVAAADLNLDGKLDLIAVVNSNNTLLAFRNDTVAGSTTFAFGTGQSLSAVGGPGAISIGDLNQDGRPDLVMGGSPNHIGVLLNSTAPGSSTFTFQPMLVLTNPANASVRNQTLTDVNLDGKPDIVCTNRYTNGVGVFINTTPANATTASFASRVDFLVNGEPLMVWAGDINLDGRPDVVASDHFSGIVSILMNTTTPGSTTPSFAPKFDLVTFTLEYAVGLSDFNGDGKVDLFVGYQSNFMSVWTNATPIGATTPSFVGRVDYSTSANPFDFAFGDLNADGRSDAVVGQTGNSSFAVFVNATTIGLSVSDMVSTGLAATSSTAETAVVDLNNDGRRDIVAGTGTATVFMNTTSTGGMPSAFAVQAIGIDFGNQPWITGDVNLDGKIDLIAGDGVYRNTTTNNSTSATFAARANFSFASSTDSVLRFGDFDLDGRPDVLATRRDVAVGTDFRIFRNTTTPGSSTLSFAASADFSSGNVSCVDVAIADINLDGLLDVVLSTLGDGINPSTRGLAFLLNATPIGTSNFSFGTTIRFATIRIPGAIVAGDLNNDGKVDIAFINANPATPATTIISTYLNQTPAGSSGVFLSARQDFSAAAGPLTLAELDGDGKLDLIAIGAASQQNRVFVFPNQTSAGSTTVAFATPLEYLPGLPNASLAVGDFNNNGRVDLAVGQTGTSLNVALNESYQMIRGSATGTIIDNDPAPDTTPPGVAAVYFDSTAWTASFRTAVGSSNGFAAQTGGSQLVSVPWNNIDQIRVKFSENVVVDQGDLAVRGINLGNYSIVGFGYDGVSFTAVWTLAGNIDTDRLIIDLDGDSATAVTDLAGNKLAGSWTDSVSTFPTAGAPATDFRFRFVIAVGDVNRDGLVRNSDQNTVRTNLFIDAGQAGYNAFADIDGNGQTRNADLNAVRSHLFIDPPAGPGPNRPVRGSTGESRDHRVGLRGTGYVTSRLIDGRRTDVRLRPIRNIATANALDQFFAEGWASRP